MTPPQAGHLNVARTLIAALDHSVAVRGQSLICRIIAVLKRQMTRKSILSGIGIRIGDAPGSRGLADDNSLG